MVVVVQKSFALRLLANMEESLVHSFTGLMRGGSKKFGGKKRSENFRGKRVFPSLSIYMLAALFTQSLVFAI